jgi:hypothetical protein
MPQLGRRGYWMQFANFFHQSIRLSTIPLPPKIHNIQKERNEKILMGVIGEFEAIERRLLAVKTVGRVNKEIY